MNKIVERFQLDQFLKCIGLAPNRIDDFESPDFIIYFDNKKIGIELTSIKQSSIASIAGNHRKIVQNAYNKAIQANIEPIDVHVWFYDHEITNVQLFIKEASEYLFRLIASNIDTIKAANGNTTKIKCTGNKYNISQVTAHWHTINGNRWLYDHRWKTEEPGFVSTSFRNIIQNEITKKNAKLLKYLTKCNSCWLLIVIDRSKRDEHFDYEYIKSDGNYESAFEKNYLFDLMERKVYLLKS